MVKFSYSKKQKSKFEEELLRYKEFLNLGAGALSFTLAWTCLGTKKPSLSALICMLFIAVMVSYGYRHYPTDLLKLKDKNELDEKEELLLTGLHNKHFGFKGLLSNFSMFYFGFASLMFVWIWGEKIRNYFY